MRPIAQFIINLFIFLGIGLSTNTVFAATFDVLDGEYKLPASIDPAVTTKAKTELWAHVWRPNTGGPYPLVVFLHGNHGTCGKFIPELGVRDDDRIDYTQTGKCPEGYVVTPNHLGYSYLAQNLATYGFIVVSINANRGVTAANPEGKDTGLNLRRGRLVLRHLQELATWNAKGGTPASLGFELKGMIDFTQVGLMGHSRGGEGMRAAVAQFNDPDSPWPKQINRLKFRSLFEIGPVDGQTNRILNPKGLVWNVLLPSCDGDVSDLQGIKPFDRMLQDKTEIQRLTKSSFQVFGANHNFYNTEWQVSDSLGCRGQTPLFPFLVGSATQRSTALQTLIPFFRSNLGPTPLPVFAQRFDPSYPLPESLTEKTFYARGFAHNPYTSKDFILDDFDHDTGISSQNVENQASGLLDYAHGATSGNHDLTQRAALVSWNQPDGFLQINAATGQGVNINNYRTLEFRVMLSCFDERFEQTCLIRSKPTGDVNFSISLVDADAKLSESVALKDYAAVHRPGGSVQYSPTAYIRNEILQTVRIPLSNFKNIDLSRFIGVRFTFNRSEKAAIYLANLHLTRTPTNENASIATVDASTELTTVAQPALWKNTPMEQNKVVDIRHLRTEASATERSSSVVEIELASTRPFTVGNALPTLMIKDKAFNLAHYPTGDTHQLVFTLEEAEFAKAQTGDPLIVHMGGSHPWVFGALDKTVSH